MLRPTKLSVPGKTNRASPPDAPRGRPRLARTLLAPALLALLLLAPAPARAILPSPDPPPDHLIYYRDLLAAQWNPLGLQNDIFVGYRYRLVHSDSLLFRNTYVGPLAIVRLNPAFARLGLGAEVQPLAALTLRVLWEHRLYFGSFNLLQSWRSPYDDYDEDTVKARGKAGQNYPGNGHQFTFQAVFRAKWGPLVILNDFQLNYFHMYLREGDRVFYVSLLDTMAPGKGFTIVNSAHLLFLTHFRLLFGLRYTVVESLYPDEWLDESRGGNPNTPNQRLGPMVAYVFKTKSKYFKQPTLIFMLNWWIENRYRAGQKVDQAFPYGALALQFTGDLWSK